MEKYRKLKEEIRRRNKAKARQVTKISLEQGRKEDKEDFLIKIAGSSGTQSTNVI